MALIEIEEVFKIYQVGEGELHALDGVSLQVDHGELVAVMGASGSGKSTLMNVLGLLDTPTAGSYRLRDREVAHLDDDALSETRNREIGFVFQTFNLLPRMTALANVELPLTYGGLAPAERRSRAAELLAQVGLADRMHHRPSELSGGQRQRVAIARALCNRPALLLADEPTGNLDSRVTAEIMALFQELNDAGITIVFVTHEPDVAQYAKRKVVMRDGRIVADEPVRDRTLAAAVVAAAAPGAGAAP